eukprot:TRINITY_DN5182_c0_g1_i1.p1 TRINITY_DN5182_c0_g1~~TRINITY_DN5182_c0_g1_i1.p1  ORF type:complete len:132 (+),score=2.09 TRINITY_DN5182_c0_g1_i1:45-440(+)
MLKKSKKPKTIDKVQTKYKNLKFANKWIPKVKKPYHIVCFVLNIFIPGSGTIIAAIMDKMDWVNIVFGIIQFLTFIIILGWIWSIIWGYAIYARCKGIGSKISRPKKNRAKFSSSNKEKTPLLKSKSKSKP